MALCIKGVRLVLVCLLIFVCVASPLFVGRVFGTYYTSFVVVDYNTHSPVGGASIWVEDYGPNQTTDGSGLDFWFGLSGSHGTHVWASGYVESNFVHDYGSGGNEYLDVYLFSVSSGSSGGNESSSRNVTESMSSSKSGNFVGGLADLVHFQAGDGDGEADFSHVGIANFSGFTVCLNFSSFKNHASFYDLFQVEKTCKFLWNVSGIYINLEFGDVHNLGGLLDNYWVYYASSDNRSDFGVSWWDFSSVKQGRDHWDYTNDCFYVYVEKVNDTCVRVGEYKDKGLSGTTQLCSNDYVVDSSWWCSVDIGLTVHDSGSGAFFCNYHESVGSASSPSSYDTVQADNPFYNFFSNLNGLFGHILPKSITDFIGSITNWGGFLQPVLSALWSAVLMVLPYLPFLLLMYVVDAGVSSMAEGSFQPIGAVFSQLYSLGAMVINALVSIASAIYSFVKFW